jgi:type I restriction enzyme M protein
MLDSTTKARIDSARDILVGKVPDPKSQVEQITIALIYKFMDDMDRQSEELGGKSSFFKGEFKKYRWADLLDKRIGGHERLLRYAEGIERMNENKNIPQLFRDIFKGVFLPYRDPETLNLFLKEINGFTYEHSEHLGDAFEYLLSVLGTQGEAGQFRTPRHIIDFIVTIVNPRKHETVLDPACGTAGFLISAFKHILNHHKELSPDERAKLMTNFSGYDIAPDMVRLSRANLYLHGFPSPVIHEYDTLTSEERWDERFDVILANPPFMTPKGGIRPHNRFSVKAKRSEVLFVDYIVEHLNPSGRAGVIVPEGIVERTDKPYQKLHELLLKEYLIGVISLPAGLFLPYTKVKTSILVIDRTLVHRGLPVLFSHINQSGISLDSARAEILNNDLPTILKDYENMRDGKQVSSLSWFVERDKLLSRKSSLSGAQFKPKAARGSAKWIRLGDVCKITKGSSSSTKTKLGKYPLVVRGEERLTSNRYEFEGEAVCVPLLSLAHGHGQIKRVHYVSGKFAVANLLAVVQPLDARVLDAKYLYLTLDSAKDQIAQLMKGSVYVTLKIEDLEDFEIPLPQLSAQRALANQYDTVQSIIAKNNQLISDMEDSMRGSLAKLWGTHLEKT